MTQKVKPPAKELTEVGKLKYKICRENAGMTQNEACYHLGIENVETLSRYENGHNAPPDKIVASMAMLYRNKKLVKWHMRRIHPELADFIVYPDDVNNIHEMIWQIELNADSAYETMAQVKEYLRDGALCDDDITQLKEKDVPAMRRAIEGLTAVLMFMEKM